MQKTAPIAWILIGLLIGGSLFDYLATSQQSGACIELRVLEQEDNRSDVSDLVYIHFQNTWFFSSDTLADDFLVLPKLDIWSGQQAAHLQRGPPSRVLA